MAKKSDDMLAGFQAPRVITPTGFIWENARGGPYKYGYPLKATVLNLRAAKAGLL